MRHMAAWLNRTDSHPRYAVARISIVTVSAFEKSGRGRLDAPVIRSERPASAARFRRWQAMLGEDSPVIFQGRGGCWVPTDGP